MFKNGFVYVISNEYWRDLKKIGMASNLKKRLSQYITSVPTPIILNFKSDELIDAYFYEQLAHFLLSHFRFSKRREFFNASLDDIEIVINIINSLNSKFFNNELLLDFIQTHEPSYYKKNLISSSTSPYTFNIFNYINVIPNIFFYYGSKGNILISKIQLNNFKLITHNVCFDVIENITPELFDSYVIDTDKHKNIYLPIRSVLNNLNIRDDYDITFFKNTILNPKEILQFKSFSLWITDSNKLVFDIQNLFDIHILKDNFNFMDNDIIIFPDLMYNDIIKHFRYVGLKPNNMYELKIFYLKILRNFIGIKIYKNIINNSCKIKHNCILQIDVLKYFLGLYKLQNPTFLNCNQHVLNWIHKP